MEHPSEQCDQISAVPPSLCPVPPSRVPSPTHQSLSSRLRWTRGWRPSPHVMSSCRHCSTSRDQQQREYSTAGALRGGRPCLCNSRGTFWDEALTWVTRRSPASLTARRGCARTGKTSVGTGFGISSGFKHPLGVLECVPCGFGGTALPPYLCLTGWLLTKGLRRGT